MQAESRPITARGELSLTEKTNIDIFQQASPSVVYITTLADTLNLWTRDITRMPQGTGSGFIWDKQGHIITNYHVLQGVSAVKIRLSDQRTFNATFIGASPDHDIAVLRIPIGANMPDPLSLGTSHDLQVGQAMYAIGNPFGLQKTVTAGIVSAKGRSINNESYGNFIQTDASINPGNSGGPLFNMKGEVVGINTAIIPQGQGIGFAIPVNTAKPLIPQLVEHGEITRGYLGVNIQTITPDLAKALEVEEHSGALVADVTPDSPAAKAGIERGDIIIDFDDQKIKDSRDLPAKVAATPVGEEVELTVLRDGQQKQLTVSVGELAADDSFHGKADDAGKGKWGLQLHDLNENVAKQLRVEAQEQISSMGASALDPIRRLIG